MPSSTETSSASRKARAIAVADLIHNMGSTKHRTAHFIASKLAQTNKAHRDEFNTYNEDVFDALYPFLTALDSVKIYRVRNRAINPTTFNYDHVLYKIVRKRELGTYAFHSKVKQAIASVLGEIRYMVIFQIGNVMATLENHGNAGIILSIEEGKSSRDRRFDPEFVRSGSHSDSSSSDGQLSYFPKKKEGDLSPRSPQESWSSRSSTDSGFENAAKNAMEMGYMFKQSLDLVGKGDSRDLFVTNVPFSESGRLVKPVSECLNFIDALKVVSIYLPFTFEESLNVKNATDYRATAKDLWKRTGEIVWPNPASRTFALNQKQVKRMWDWMVAVKSANQKLG